MRQRLKTARRIIVKLGTHVVTDGGRELALGRLFALVESMARLRSEGREIIVVSSGAVALGGRVLGLTAPPDSLGLRQACAAAGQGRLISLYTDGFSEFGLAVAQVLLTQEDLADPERALCLRTTLLRLLERGAVPILNENDSVSVREIVTRLGPRASEPAFGDNDELSARVAIAVDADLLVLLTDVDGVYSANPNEDRSANLITEIVAVDDAILARTSGQSSSGRGGMQSKLQAAQIAMTGGVDVLIAGGRDDRVLERALAGEAIGTLLPSGDRRSGKKRRIALDPAPGGALTLNPGAVRALVERKASLLPVGITAVEGDFHAGAVVELRDEHGLALGRGLVNYDAEACRRLAGEHSDRIAEIIGYRGYDALVTRDNLSLGEV